MSIAGTSTRLPVGIRAWKICFFPATHSKIATFITAYAWPGPRFQPICSPARRMRERETPRRSHQGRHLHRHRDVCGDRNKVERLVGYLKQ